MVRFPPLPGAGKGDKDSRDGGKDGKEKDNDDNGDDEEEDSLPEAKELLREMGMSESQWALGVRAKRENRVRRQGVTETLVPAR